MEECHAKGQPVLVGTVSIEKNELLSRMLTKAGIKHNVLNAKNHEREAEIVAQAGKLGAVTVATNMAGRGTDIMLGGNAEYMATSDLRKAGLSDELIAEATGYAETDNQEILDARRLFAQKLQQHKEEIAGEAEQVRQAGGLFIVGTERHDSRRIDNQLRGRAGRQGDPGETRFYISLEDDLMRLFGGERINAIMERMNLDEDTPIENKMLTRAIEQAHGIILKMVIIRNFKKVFIITKCITFAWKLVHTRFIVLFKSIHAGSPNVRLFLERTLVDVRYNLFNRSIQSFQRGISIFL